MLIEEANSLKDFVNEFHLFPINQVALVPHKAIDGISISGPGSNIYYIFKKQIPFLKIKYHSIFCCDEDGLFKIGNSFDFKKAFIIVYGELLLDRQ